MIQGRLKIDAYRIAFLYIGRQNLDYKQLMRRKTKRILSHLNPKS